MNIEKTAERLMTYLALVLDERYTKEMMVESLKKSIVD